MPRPKGVKSYEKQENADMSATEKILISGWVRTRLAAKGYTILRVANEVKISQAARFY